MTDPDVAARWPARLANRWVIFGQQVTMLRMFAPLLIVPLLIAVLAFTVFDRQTRRPQ